jgi:hypothetical protein
MDSFLRIATWNAGRPAKGSAKNPAIIEFIRNVNADIWILTETHDVISPGKEYTDLSAPRLACFRPGEHASTIWLRRARFPASEPVISFADCPEERTPCVGPTYAVRGTTASPAVSTIVKTSIGELLVYGTVITWMNDKGPEGMSPFGHEHCRAIDAHGRDWLRLLGSNALCVAGDFNVTFSGRHYGDREKLQNALESNDLVCATREFDGLVDHICISRRWRERVANPKPWPVPLFHGKSLSADHPAATSIDLTLEPIAGDSVSHSVKT